MSKITYVLSTYLGVGWFFKQSHEIPYFHHGYKDIKNYDDRYQIQNFRNISSKYVQNHLCLKYTFGGGWFLKNSGTSLCAIDLAVQHT